MKYIIDIPKDLLDKIRLILAKGEYKNINEIIITALENQINLEEIELKDEDFYFATRKISKSFPIRNKKEKEQEDIFKWTKFKETYKIKIYPMPDIKDLKFKDSDYSKLWLWGQTNRIFPIKIGLRILANMQQKEGDYVPLLKFKEKASELARIIGQRLKKIDNQLNRKRDECISVGLPVGNNKEKAEMRYKSHFLASKRVDSILDGAMARLKFINIKESNNRIDFIGLTKEGLEFTKLKNPILDENINSERSLSDNEIEFYLNHINVNVPEELNPIRNILEIIKNGINSLTEMDSEIRKIKPTWTHTFISTNRSGALGRMNELGLIKKSKKGINVIYEISDRGKKYLEGLKNGY